METSTKPMNIVQIELHCVGHQKDTGRNLDRIRALHRGPLSSGLVVGKALGRKRKGVVEGVIAYPAAKYLNFTNICHLYQLPSSLPTLLTSPASVHFTHICSLHPHLFTSPTSVHFTHICSLHPHLFTSPTSVHFTHVHPLPHITIFID
jgi:hypothetical protein